MDRKKLAIIITTDKYMNHISGLIEAAAKKDCVVSVFIMDKGVFLTENKEFVLLIEKYRSNIDKVSVCEHSCNVNEVISRIDEFNYASQFENAKMISGLEEKDRALLF
ncbi:MAG: hypothetical protein M1276_04970 [Deltaproteobacteria bacterium]|nr:hypothetical protein [Deltaproteobacteria bacterium]